MARCVVAILICLFCLTSIAAATDLKINVEPPSQEILIGGSGSYAATVNCSVEPDTGSHVLTISYYKNNSPTDKLYCDVSLISAPPGVDPGDVNLVKISSTPSSVTYSWHAPAIGDYVFEIKVSFNQSSQEPIQVGERFIILVSDNKVNTVIQASATAYAIAIPELLTSALVGAGILTCFIASRKL